MNNWELFVVALLALGASACSSGGSSSCSTKNGTVLADTAWPKFRRDLANTGRAAVDLDGNSGVARRIFPPADRRIGTVATTPILDTDQIIVTSVDSNVYVLDRNGASILDTPIETPAAITTTPLLGADGTLFVAAGDGVLRQYRPDGSIRKQTTLGGFFSGSPTIANDGTIYQGSLAGSFTGVCQNGVPRFSLFPIAPVQSSAAVTPDPDDPDPGEWLVIFGVNTGQVRAVDRKGRERWSLFEPNMITGAVVLDEPEGRFFVAEGTGRVTAASIASGLPDDAFHFQAAAKISAALALGSDDLDPPSLYAADEGGTLYAIDRTTGAVRWTYRVDATIRSAPAVSTAGATDVIVFGADDGYVYAVADGGNEANLLWAAATDAPIGQSSPSIGLDGTVFIGTEDIGEGGAVYAIGGS